MQQGSEEWFQARCGVITGSAFSRVSGAVARESLVYEIVGEILTGTWSESPGNVKSLEWGHLYENEARSLYEAETGFQVEQVGTIFHQDTMLVSVSPDGLVGDNGLIEIKCPMTPREHTRHLVKGIPKDYKPQAYGQMLVTDSEWVDFVSYHPGFPEHLQLSIHRVERDEKSIAKLENDIMDAVSQIEIMLTKLDDKTKGGE